MAIPAIPAQGAPWLTYATALDTEVRTSFARKYQAGMEVSENFATYPNGAAPATVRTGQTATAYGANDVTGRQPAIVGGKLTYADSSQFIGSYFQVQTDSDVMYLSAGFTFSSWSTGGGLVCLAITEQDFVAYHRTHDAVPRAPFHLTINPEGWGLDTFPTAGGAPNDGGPAKAGGLWKNGNLASDGATVHRVTAVIDRKKGEAYLFLPDGTATRVAHVDLTIPGAYSFVEVFRDAAAGRTQAAIVDYSVDSRRTDLITPAKAAARAQFTSAETFPGSASNMTLTTTPSKVNGTTMSFVVPPSGTVMLDVEALLDVTSNGPVHLGIFDGSDALVAVRTVATKIMNGRVSMRIPYSPAALVGAKVTVSMCAYLGSSSAGTLILGNSGTVYGSASITATPLP